jgi:2-oxo-4-hydroxy-4-carboxy-5-ureidoimidazoline decarboxylase
MTLDEVNALDESGFVAAFGPVYEDSPALTAAAHARGPFADRDALVVAFGAALDGLDDDDALALLRAHPQLGVRSPMGDASSAEQAGAGLAGEEPMLEQIRTGNDRYAERFGFPFIIAVRGLGPTDIATAQAIRLGNDEPTERATALAEVRRIAALRVEQVLA